MVIKQVYSVSGRGRRDEVSRTGNRSDVRELPEYLITTAENEGAIMAFIRRSLEAFRNAAERKILTDTVIRGEAPKRFVNPGRHVFRPGFFRV
jgi:hypothetical protein